MGNYRRGNGGVLCQQESSFRSEMSFNVETNHGNITTTMSLWKQKLSNACTIRRKPAINEPMIASVYIS